METPEGYVFIRKLEETLGIRILKPEIAEELERQKRQLGFDNHSTKNLTIADLQEMKQEEGFVEKKKPYWRRFVQGLIGRKEEKDDVVEISQEDLEKLRELEDPSVEESMESEGIPVEFDDTSLEIERELPKESKQGMKKDLSDKDINDIIFGRK